MNKFFHSPAMLYIMAGMLVLVFFLPELIGPLPALVCGALVLAFSFYVYNLWCKEPPGETEHTKDIGSPYKLAPTAINEVIEPPHEMENTMLLDLLRERRSIRKFIDQKVEEEKIDILVEAVLRSPSSRGLKPWEFVVVTNKETLSALAQSRPRGSSFLAGASLAFVVCADPSKSDVWIEDASIASLLLHLCAADLGLGSCWIQIRNRQYDDRTDSETFVKRILGLTPDMVVEAIVAIGYSSAVKPGHAADTLLYNRVSYEKYGNRR